MTGQSYSDEKESLQHGGYKPVIVYGLNKPSTPEPLGEQPKAVRRQELIGVLVNVGIFAIGMGLSLPAVTLRQLTDPEEQAYLTKSQGTWYASINSMGSPLGALMTALLLDRIGRKKTLILINAIAIIAWAVMATASRTNSETLFIQLIVSRIAIGIGIGMGSAPPGVYGAEISLPKIRGRLILGVSIAVALGILFVYVLGYFIRDDWHLIALILLGFQITCLVLLIPVPETPSWLLSKGRDFEAKKSLSYFRGLDAGQTHPEVEAEFTVLQKAIQLRDGEKKLSFIKSVKEPEIYKPLLIMIGLFCCQQLSGIFVIIVYAVQIAIEAGVNIDPILCAVFIGIARVVVTCMMCSLLEKWGRRGAGLFSAAGSAICMFILAMEGWFPGVKIPYLSAVALVVFIVCSTMGLLTLPFFMIPEVFPQKLRGPCAGITGCFGFLMTFIVLKAHPALNEQIGTYNVFGFYGAMATLSLFFVYFFLPETKGKTLLEIEEYFRSGKKESPRAADVEMKDVKQVFLPKET